MPSGLNLKGLTRIFGVGIQGFDIDPVVTSLIAFEVTFIGRLCLTTDVDETPSLALYPWSSRSRQPSRG